MYGSESWTLNKTLLSKLESFQAEVGKCILQLPKSTLNTIPLLALNWPTCAPILCSKISYLLRICNAPLKSQTFNAIATSDVHLLELVKQCKLLASHFEPLRNLTEEILSNLNLNEPSVRSVRERILSADRTNVLSSSVGHPSLFYPLKIARKHGWMKLLDIALDHGLNGTRAGLAILKLLFLTVFSDRRCPVDNCEHIIPQGTPFCAHFTECHTDLESNHTFIRTSNQPEPWTPLRPPETWFINHIPFLTLCWFFNMFVLVTSVLVIVFECSSCLRVSPDRWPSAYGHARGHLGSGDKGPSQEAAFS